MAVTSNFKEYERQGRTMTVETLFNAGMKYVDTPLTDGYAKLLVNYDLKNQGTTLSPRGGFKKLRDVTTVDTSDYIIHHTGTTYVQSSDGSDAELCRYIILAKLVQTAENLRTEPEYQYAFDPYYLAKCIVHYKDTDLVCTISVPNTDTIYSYPTHKVSNIHSTAINEEIYCQEGIYTSLDNNTYIPMNNGVANTSFDYTLHAYNTELRRLNIAFTDTTKTAITAELVSLTPKEIAATAAINTGYNMLKDDPYTFEDSQNNLGTLVLEGLLPRNPETDELLLSANVGDTVKFCLNYSYPISDLNRIYLISWEIHNTITNAVTVLQSVQQSPQYAVSLPISHTFKVPYQQFTVVVKVYYGDKAVGENGLYVILGQDELANATPIQVMTVSSYSLTSSIGSSTNLTPNDYDLGTCTGMCTWQQRLVVWGVRGAATALFMSQPNVPEYFPYPNGVEILPEEVVKCVPYLTDLLVFTTSKLYRLSMVIDTAGTYVKTTCVQERLIMTKEDASTIQVVKNMVYFKSGNYFYMIVPNNTAGAGELQLAPVSRPIEHLLDTFADVKDSIIDTVYNIAYTYNIVSGSSEHYTIDLIDYYNYLDGAVVRNVYKCKIQVLDEETVKHVSYLDLVLNYDTVLRCWTTYMYENTNRRLVTYVNTITDNMTFASIIGTTASVFQFDNTSSKDEAFSNTFVNRQLIDTGYRDHFSPYKKRFREIQFVINNSSQTSLQFHTSFFVDNDERKPLYTHTVSHVTDEEDANYGVIYVERVLNEAELVNGAMPNDTGWVLDSTMFPDISLVKVRYKVSGKGYNGRMILLSNNDTAYELVNINWIYRKMNGR